VAIVHDDGLGHPLTPVVLTYLRCRMIAPIAGKRCGFANALSFGTTKLCEKGPNQ
jgi:hypothetical protein